MSDGTIDERRLKSHSVSELADLIRGMLHKDPDMRLSLLDVSHHPFMASYIANAPTYSEEMNKAVSLEMHALGFTRKAIATIRSQPLASPAAATWFLLKQHFIREGLHAPEVPEVASQDSLMDQSSDELVVPDETTSSSVRAPPPYESHVSIHGWNVRTSLKRTSSDRLSDATSTRSDRNDVDDDATEDASVMISEDSKIPETSSCAPRKRSRISFDEARVPGSI